MIELFIFVYSWIKAVAGHAIIQINQSKFELASPCKSEIPVPNCIQ